MEAAAEIAGVWWGIPEKMQALTTARAGLDCAPWGRREYCRRSLSKSGRRGARCGKK